MYKWENIETFYFEVQMKLIQIDLKPNKRELYKLYANAYHFVAEAIEKPLHSFKIALIVIGSVYLITKVITR